MQDEQPSVLLFQGFQLDLARGCLRAPGGTELLLRPKSFDVLRYMLEHAGRLVSRDELMQAVWRDVIVTDDSITQCITEVRRVLGDNGQRLLKTAPRRGYLLEAEVTRGKAGTEASHTTGTDDRAASDSRKGPLDGAPGPIPADLPSLVVLPFANLSGDPEQEYFVDGMTEALTTALSRARSFFVIARNSAFTYKGRAVDVRQVGRDLGVRYVLEGSVRKAGGRVRISAQLIETQTGHHIWADRFESSLGDVFDLQDQITAAVAATIEPNLRKAEMARSAMKPTASLDAYDLYLRALPQHYWLTRSGSDAALDLLHKAISFDPDFALAKAFAAIVHQLRKVQGWSGPEEWAKGACLARQALSSTPDDPTTLRHAAVAVVFLGQDFDAGIAAVDRALALNPYSAEVVYQAGWVYTWACEPKVAISLFEQAMRLNPLNLERAYALSGIGFAHLIAGDPTSAVQWGERSVQYSPTWAAGHRLLIAALMLSGREAAAREAAITLQRMAPRTNHLSNVANVYRNSEWAQRYLAALRAAGLSQ